MAETVVKLEAELNSYSTLRSQLKESTENIEALQKQLVRRGKEVVSSHAILNHAAALLLLAPSASHW